MLDNSSLRPFKLSLFNRHFKGFSFFNFPKNGKKNRKWINIHPTDKNGSAGFQAEPIKSLRRKQCYLLSITLQEYVLDSASVAIIQYTPGSYLFKETSFNPSSFTDVSSKVP